MKNGSATSSYAARRIEYAFLDGTKESSKELDVADLVPRIADPDRMLGAEDEGGMATFLSMPLKARGRIVGVLGLSSATKNAFGETSLNTLRLVESPAALVIENARLSGGVLG